MKCCDGRVAGLVHRPPRPGKVATLPFFLINSQPQTSAWESRREGKEAQKVILSLSPLRFPTNQPRAEQRLPRKPLLLSAILKRGLPCLPLHEPRLPGQLTARKAFPSGPCRHGVPPCACLVGKVDHWNDDVGPIDTTYYHHRDT